MRTWNTGEYAIGYMRTCNTEENKKIYENLEYRRIYENLEYRRL